MYHKLIKVDTPQIFFKHELGQLSNHYAQSFHHGHKPKYFTFLDKDGKLTDKVLYEPYDNLNDRKYYGNQICVMKRCEEERYSQSVIDSCSKDYKKRGIKQYEWHMTKKPAVINTVCGECVFIAEHEMDYVYVYENVIYYCSHFGGKKKILDWLGHPIVENFNEMFETKTHLIIKKEHDYKTGLDVVVCVNKLTGNIDNQY